MSWQERLLEAAYTTPSGTRLTFQFRDVSRQGTKRTAAFDFPDADGTFIQNNGKSGRRYPLNIYFSGNDYDLEAKAFFEGLDEDGVGILEHPAYGTVNVVPFGQITQKDDLATGANQAVFQVVFWATIGTLYPTAQGDPADAVGAAIAAFNVTAAEQFAESVEANTAVETTTLRNRYQTVLDSVQSVLQPIADVQDDVRRQFNAVFDSINAGIDTLVGTPVTLAAQTVTLVQLPGQALAAILDRLDAYGNLISTLISDQSYASCNDFSTNDLFAMSSGTGAIVSVVNNQFNTKPEALAAAESLLVLGEEVTDWRDLGFEALDLVDTGEAYQKFQEAIALAAGFLVEISFALAQERQITLDRNRTIIDLAAELYGEVDPKLDFLIDSNNLSGSEILEIPEGRRIVYYV